MRILYQVCMKKKNQYQYHYLFFKNATILSGKNSKRLKWSVFLNKKINFWSTKSLQDIQAMREMATNTGGSKV